MALMTHSAGSGHVNKCVHIKMLYITSCKVFIAFPK